jgi:hypothetical protein
MGGVGARALFAVTGCALKTLPEHKKKPARTGITIAYLSRGKLKILMLLLVLAKDGDSAQE